MIKEINDKEIYIRIDNNYCYDLTQKVIALLFKEYRENIASNDDGKTISISDKKIILNKFEKVMKCLRYEVLGLKDIYKNNTDNLEVLVELSEVISIKDSIKELIDIYQKNLLKETIEITVLTELDNADRLEVEIEANFSKIVNFKFNYVDEKMTRSNLIIRGELK